MHWTLTGGDADSPGEFYLSHGRHVSKRVRLIDCIERNPVHGGSESDGDNFVQPGWRGELSAGDSRNRV